MDVDFEETSNSTQDRKNCVKEMVRAILILDQSKKPFTKGDIAKFLNKRLSAKTWALVLENTKQALDNLGYTLITTRNASKSFILVSKIAPLPSMYRQADSKEIADRILLTFILAYIFMKGGSVSNVSLFSHLGQLNIYKEDGSNHIYFGDVKNKVLREFVNQLYLEKIIDKNSDAFEFKWGERAEAEVSKRSILKFVCEVGYGDTIKPENFTDQYQEVLNEEQEVIPME